jgi:MFS family permease
LLLAAYAYNFLDRQILSVALQAIKTDLALSDTQLGVLTGPAFALVYALAGLPIARVADRSHRPAIIAAALGTLSAAVALCGVTSNFLQLVGTRIGAALGEAGIIPPSHSLLASYFERAERLRAMSILLLGGPLSMAVGFLSGGWLTQFFGWRAAFVAIAIPGFILTGLMAFTVRDPRTFSGTVVRGKDSTSASSMRTVLAVLWGRPTFRHLLIASAVIYLFGYGLVQWLPVFFIRVHAMSTGELGTWMAINWGLGNAIGTFAGGYLIAGTANAERRQLQIMAAVAIVFVPINLAVLLSAHKYVSLLAMFVGAVVNALAAAPTFALIQSLVEERMRATAVAAVFLVSNLIGMGIGPLAVGIMSEALASQYGAGSVRLALLACLPGYLWVAAHYLKASQTVSRDLERLEQGA